MRHERQVGLDDVVLVELVSGVGAIHVAEFLLRHVRADQHGKKILQLLVTKRCRRFHHDNPIEKVGLAMFVRDVEKVAMRVDVGRRAHDPVSLAAL